MDILKIAKDIEKQGVEHYRELSKSVKSKQLQGIFKLLADEEQRHYRLFDALGSTLKGPEPEQSDIIAKSKEVFESFIKDFAVPDNDDSLEAAYQKAIELEKNSISFYKYALGETEDQNEKKVIQIILDEEGKHIKIIESIIEFVRKPQQWLENAEWRHLDEY